MDAEQLRAFALTLPHVEESMQWGANLVFWVGDKKIGGKMFALMNLDAPHIPDTRAGKPTPVLAFYAGSERYPQLLEHDGVIPAPYLARAYWIAILHWKVFPARELQTLLEAARDGVHAKLPARLRSTLASGLPLRATSRTQAEKASARKR